jgi:hypothetical protein
VHRIGTDAVTVETASAAQPLDVGILFGITSLLAIIAGRLYPSLGT